MIDSLIETIIENFILLSFLLFLIIILYVISRTIRTVVVNKNSVQMGELALQHEKLDMLKRQTLIKTLAESSVVLSDKEKERLDSINEDVSVLSRKNLALMNEVEGRTTRLERGVELTKLKAQMDKIRANEKKMFGQR